MPEDVKTF